MPASSMLTVIVIIYSVPVLVYVVLFYPELKKLVRGRTRSEVQVRKTILSWHGERSNELLFECLLPMVAAAATALMFGLLVGISWHACLMLMGVLAALIGGVAFTFLKMHSVGRRPGGS